ncbi:ABC transporter ATP-binding protein [Nonomuraea rubra]|uniref:ABC transporter ATP-binding protein n=1 Tax=Nonomuraea rubra TaxID=46180 RepID=UPI003614A27D
MAGIEVTALHKRYPDGTVAVDQVDLSIGDGELFVMLGPSGCGKTTTLRAIAGLERQTTGDIRIGDTLVNDLPPAERDIAMVFQFYALYPHLRTRDNLAFPLRAEGLPKAEVRERVEEAARLMRLGPLLDRRPRRLSGGEQQRVALARALVRRPRAFLMDEPLTNLDAELRADMRTEIKHLQGKWGRRWSTSPTTRSRRCRSVTGSPSSTRAASSRSARRWRSTTVRRVFSAPRSSAPRR